MEPNDFKIKPNGDRLYVKLDEVPNKSGSIYLTETQALPSRIGTVIDAGPEVKAFSVGDRVLISSYSGVNLYLWQYGIKNEQYRILTETEILATVTKE